MICNGERMIPEQHDPDTFWEHLYRYAFAARFAEGKRVLDIACGEGYGTAALVESGAARVVGVDISDEACRHAAQKYRIDVRIGDAQHLPFADESFDLVVSFETIEHLNDPLLFLDECARVLASRGAAIISTPNKIVYDTITPDNPFHLHELEREQFEEACRKRFGRVKIFSQRPLFAPWWSVRGLAAVSWPTNKIRGMGRLRNCLARVKRDHLSNLDIADARIGPAKAITQLMKQSHNVTDPYAVRREWPIVLDSPVYLLAFCEKA